MKNKFYIFPKITMQYSIVDDFFLPQEVENFRSSLINKYDEEDFKNKMGDRKAKTASRLGDLGF